MANLTVTETAPQGGDHQTLDEACDAIGAGETITIQDTWNNPDTREVDIGTNCIITADGAARVTTARHVSGTPTHYRLHGDGDHCITIADATPITSIDGIEIKQVGSTASDECIRQADDGGELTVTNCILSSASAANDQDGIYAGSIACTINLENDLIYKFERAGCHGQMTHSGTDTQTWNINSCSFYLCGENSENRGGAVSIDRDDGSNTYLINIHNTWALGCSYDQNDTFNELDALSTATWGISYSIDDDNSIAGRDGGGAGNQANVTIADTDQGAGAYVIVNGDIDGAAPWDLALTDLDNTKNVAQDEHAQEVAEGLTIPGTDIDATARPDNTNYDVGAFEIVSGAPPEGAAGIITTNTGFWGATF